MARPNAPDNLTVACLLAFHLALVLPLAFALNIWSDEASTLYTTQHGLWHAVQHAAANEKQAPLYFWIMGLWRSIDGSIFFARLFSVLCSALSIIFFARIARRFFARRASVLATAFFALHPFLIWASLEIRVYSFVVLLSLVLIDLGSKIFFETPDAEAAKSGMHKVLFCIASVVGLYTNYYLGFLLVGLFAALVVSNRWRSARQYLLCMLPVLLAFLPMLIAMQTQFADNTRGLQGERTLFEGLRYLWHNFLTFVLPIEVFPDAETSTVEVARTWVVRAAIVIVGVFAAVRRDRISSRTISLGASLLVIAGFMLTAYFLLGSVYVALRHASVALVPLILFGASLVDDIFGRRDRTLADGRGSLATVGIGIVVLASFSYATLALYPQQVKRGDWARVGQFIEQNESPGQPIIVFTTFDALALPYYYRGVNQILPDERFFEFGLQTPIGTEDGLVAETDFVIGKIPSAAEQIWLVVNEKCLTTDACMPLQNFVAANYTVDIEKELYLEKLYLLRKKRP